VDAGAELADEAGAEHELVAQRFGVGGILPEGGDERLRAAHGYEVSFLVGALHRHQSSSAGAAARVAFRSAMNRSTSPRLALRMSIPTRTSSVGSAESETRTVSPMPSERSAPRPTADLIVPTPGVPASVTPRWRG